MKAYCNDCNVKMNNVSQSETSPFTFNCWKCGALIEFHTEEDG